MVRRQNSQTIHDGPTEIRDAKGELIFDGVQKREVNTNNYSLTKVARSKRFRFLASLITTKANERWHPRLSSQIEQVVLAPLNARCKLRVASCRRKENYHDAIRFRARLKLTALYELYRKLSILMTASLTNSSSIFFTWNAEISIASVLELIENGEPFANAERYN